MPDFDIRDDDYRALFFRTASVVRNAVKAVEPIAGDGPAATVDRVFLAQQIAGLGEVFDSLRDAIACYDAAYALGRADQKAEDARAAEPPGRHLSAVADG